MGLPEWGGLWSGQDPHRHQGNEEAAAWALPLPQSPPQLWASAHSAQSALPGWLHCYSWLGLPAAGFPHLPSLHLHTDHTPPTRPLIPKHTNTQGV